tara:strand:+ start:1396 stop:2199 length:804 start_codon:yes stop_codon:yes gene_type:complete
MKIKKIGSISKLSSEFKNPILYKFNIGEDSFDLNNLIEKKIKIKFLEKINCIECGAKIKKTFMQGFCYPCFMKSPRTSECIFKPHLCKAHLGESKDMKWSQKYCLSDQYVYLSITSNLKVGVTRHTQIPDRWIDQGAHHAIKFAKVPNRYLAGMIEVEISKHISDRTQWRKMLQGNYEQIDLVNKKKELAKLLSIEYQEYMVKDNTIYDLYYPQLKKLEKIKSINIEKTPSMEGVLTGIKGQYLVIDNLYVLNIRKYTGYTFEIEII